MVAVISDIQKTGVLVMASRGFIVHVDMQHNRPGIAGVAMGDELKAVTRFLGYKAMTHAISISPRSDRFGYYRNSERTHPHYQDSFQVDQYIEDTIGYPHPWDRWAVRVVNTSKQAIVVELGAKRTPAYQVLRKTLQFLENTADE